ncbi:hypothetical protein O3M35_002733 [Rhynocoris fuscipes]|uniref:Thymidine kinase n=1 Tax=Rhynocoris fuscipes TaxID=488301 RepID=A0AAW1CMW6_9HEMI
MENTKKRGKLYLIIGPMFAGKTSELIRRIRRYGFSGMKYILFKYNKDTRYSYDKICSHDGKEISAISTLNLMDNIELTLDYNVIGIDEAQFFPDLVEFCEKQLETGKLLIVAGLDGTFKRTGFDNVLNLIPLAHSVDKLSAVCMTCGNNAAFSKRVGTETEIVVIGGLDMYMSVCRECYKLACPPKSSPFKDVQHENYLKLPESDILLNYIKKKQLDESKVNETPDES